MYIIGNAQLSLQQSELLYVFKIIEQACSVQLCSNPPTFNPKRSIEPQACHILDDKILSSASVSLPVTYKKKKWVISGYVTYVAWRTFWMNGCYYIIENLNSCAVDNELASTEQELTDGWSLFHDASSDNFGFWSTYIPTEFWMPENINQKDSRVYKRVITTMFMLCCIVVWCCVVTWHDMKWLNMT